MTRLFLVYFTLLHFAVVGFFIDALPSGNIISPPSRIGFYVIGGQLGVALALCVIDGFVSQRLGVSARRQYRIALLAIALALIARRLEIHFVPFRSTTIFLILLHPAFALIYHVLGVAAIILVARRYEKQLFTMFAYLAVVAILVTLYWSRSNLAPDRHFASYGNDSPDLSDSLDPPVIVIVFDGLSYEALLDSGGQIDASRFPNFSRLASDSLSFSNATTNYFQTFIVLPALIDATVALVPSRDLVIYEQTAAIERVYADSCGRNYTCRGSEFLTTRHQNRLAVQTLVRGMQLMIPPDLRPVVSRPLSWLRARTGAASPAADPRGVHVNTERMIDQLMRDLNEESRGRVFFLHTLLPHPPYVYGPEGFLDRDEIVQFEWGRPPSGHDEAERILAAYRSQIGYADQVVGEILATLENLGVYEEASLIVTADHGLRRREPVTDGRPEQVDSLMTRIPLFIKAPGLPQGWTNRDYQHIDFAPTLFDAAGVEEPSDALPSHPALVDAQPVSAVKLQHPHRTKAFLIYEGDGEFARFTLDESSQAWNLNSPILCDFGDRTGIIDANDVTYPAQGPSCLLSREPPGEHAQNR